MYTLVMTPKNPPKLGKKEVIAERNLPYWIPECGSSTKAEKLTVKRKMTFYVLARNLREAEAKILRFLAKIGITARIHRE